MPSTATTLAGEPGRPDLLVRRWAATGEPWASVLVVHGLGEHSGRYEHVGDAMAEAGLEVHAYDQRGFGASSTSKMTLEPGSISLPEFGRGRPARRWFYTVIRSAG